MEPENVSEVTEARTMRRKRRRRKGNGVYECVKDVIWADVCAPRVSLRGLAVRIWG